MFYVYILKSITTGNFYIGQTQNLDERLLRHNSGQSKYTKGKGPWQLAYFKECNNRSESLALEKKLKSYKSRTIIEKLIMTEGIPIAIGT